MPLFGPLHFGLLAGIAGLCALLARLSRVNAEVGRRIRLSLASVLALNEVAWWAYRYSHEGLRWASNLPLQLCDVTLWATVIACFTLAPRAIEFSYFAGVAGAAMALLTPDLWSPWPSYPAIYFFVAHGGIVAGGVLLVFGGFARLRPGAMWRAYAMLVTYTLLLGAFDAVFHANYMYMCERPRNPSPLDLFGGWPRYLFVTAAVALALFWLLWLPARTRTVHNECHETA